MNDNLLDELRYRSEGTDLDFKREQYRFTNAADQDKAELLKDILAMANSWRDRPAYILLGFVDRRPHPADVVGINEHLDDARLQQFVNGKLKQKLVFRYEEHVYQGHTVGVIEIPKQQRPFYASSDYHRVKSKVVYVRRGSSTGEADPEEIAKMGAADAGRGEVRFDLAVLQSSNEPLPEKFELEFFRFKG